MLLLLLVTWAPAAQFGNFTYVDDGTSVAITAYPAGASGSVSIPSVIGGKPVTRIGDYAFYACGKLSGVTIPTSVTSIGTGAFYGCVGFKRVDIPASVTSIEGNIFAGCTNLGYIGVTENNTNYSITQGGVLFNKAKTALIAYPATKFGSYSIPNTVTSIGNGAFHSCGWLSSVFIPTSVTTIGNDAFRYCATLNNLTIPSSVKAIGDGAFASCGGLEKVNLPSGLARIPNSAFNSCTKLKSIAIPTTVTSIGNDAFTNCLQLKTVTIPSGVTSIGSLAFFNCGSLTQAIFTGAAPSMGDQPLIGLMFGGTAEGFTIYYYVGSGFSSPVWLGYPAVSMGEKTPQKAWLIKWELSYDSAMLSDSNNDGVSLLMAYALNLNPTQNLSDRMPQAELTPGGLIMSFYAGASDINYSVESSVDMMEWNTHGVVLSDLDGGLMRTATVADPGSSRFLRLVVSQ